MSFPSWISNEPQSQKPCCYLEFFKISHLHSDSHSQNVFSWSVWDVNKIANAGKSQFCKIFMAALLMRPMMMIYMVMMMMMTTMITMMVIFVLILKGWSVDGGRCGTIWSAWDQLIWTSLDISTLWSSDRKQPESVLKITRIEQIHHISYIIKINQGWIDLRIPSSYYIYIA